MSAAMTPTDLPGSVPLVEPAGPTCALEPLRDCHVRLPDRVRAAGLLCVGPAAARLVLPHVMEHDFAAGVPTVVIAATDEFAVRALEAWRRARPGAAGDGKSEGSLAYLDYEHEAQSVRYNPICELRTRGDSVALARAVTYASRPGAQESPYWRSQTKSILSDVFEAMRAAPGTKPSLTDAYALFEEGVGALNAFARRHNSGALQARADFLANNHNGQTVLGEICNVFEAFQSPSVAAVSAADGLRAASVLGGGCVLVRLRHLDAAHLMPLVACLLEALVRARVRMGSSGPPALSCVIEEAAVFASAYRATAILRSMSAAGFRTTAGAGTVADCLALVDSLGARVWQGPLADTDAAYASSISGDAVFQSVTLMGGYHPVSVAPAVRKLVTADELRSLPWHPAFGGPPALFTLPGTPPFMAYLPPAPPAGDADPAALLRRLARARPQASTETTRRTRRRTSTECDEIDPFSDA